MTITYLSRLQSALSTIPTDRQPLGDRDNVVFRAPLIHVENISNFSRRSTLSHHWEHGLKWFHRQVIASVTMSRQTTHRPSWLWQNHETLKWNWSYYSYHVYLPLTFFILARTGYSLETFRLKTDIIYGPSESGRSVNRMFNVKWKEKISPSIFLVNVHLQYNNMILRRCDSTRKLWSKNRKIGHFVTRLACLLII